MSIFKYLKYRNVLEKLEIQLETAISKRDYKRTETLTRRIGRVKRLWRAKWKYFMKEI